MHRLAKRIGLVAAVGVIAIMGVAAYAFASEYIPAIDAVALRDPSLSLGSASGSAVSGTVLHLDAAVDRAVVEFRSGSWRAYAVAAGTGGTLDVVAPFRRDGGRLAPVDADVRIIARRGPLWTTSAALHLRIDAPPAVAARPGMTALFATEVARMLAERSRDWAAAAAGAGAPLPADYVSRLGAMTSDLGALSAELEAATARSDDSVTVGGVAGGRADLAFADQVLAAQLRGWGPASPSPCGAAKDAEVEAAASAAATAASVRQGAARYASALAACEPSELRALTARAGGWLGIAAQEMIADVRDAPKIAGLLILTGASVLDGSINATRLWRATTKGIALRDLVLEHKGVIEVGTGSDVYLTYDSPTAGARVKVRLSDELRAAAEQNTLLGRIIAGARSTRDVEEAMLEPLAASDFAKDTAARERVAQAVPAAPPTRTPSSIELVIPPPSAVGAAPVVTLATVPPVPPPTAAQTAAPSVTTAPPVAPVAPPAAIVAPPTAPPTVAPAASAPPQSTSTISPARDLTGTWRGGIAATGYYQGKMTCKWSGSMTMNLVQTGSTLGGNVVLTFQSSQAILAGADCSVSTENYGITGSVSASSVRLQFTGGQGGWYGAATGSFTTDLMSGTFSGSGSDYGTGCFRVSRTGLSGLPGC